LRWFWEEKLLSEFILRKKGDVSLRYVTVITVEPALLAVWTELFRRCRREFYKYTSSQPPACGFRLWILMKFSKMHGLGNDFVVIDATQTPFQPSVAWLQTLCDRRFGVGCDQVLVVDPSPAEGIDFGYRIYNADGSEVGQCGNGVRALARFVRQQGLWQQNSLKVRTQSRDMQLFYQANGDIRVNMGIPDFAPEALPLTLSWAAQYHFRESIFWAVSMGNPHAVLVVDNVDAHPVAETGVALQTSGLFPDSVNVGFLQIDSRHSGRLRVYERGSGETLACGSGACAAAAAAIQAGCMDSSVTLHMAGGALQLAWAGAGEPLFMTGPAVTVFEGTYEH
jgi:diaminopimelate epimerase